MNPNSKCSEFISLLIICHGFQVLLKHLNSKHCLQLPNKLVTYLCCCYNNYYIPFSVSHNKQNFHLGKAKHRKDKRDRDRPMKINYFCLYNKDRHQNAKNNKLNCFQKSFYESPYYLMTYSTHCAKGKLYKQFIYVVLKVSFVLHLESLKKCELLLSRLKLSNL